MRDAYRDAALQDRRRFQATTPHRGSGLLLKGIDAGLFAAIFILPFVMGGRQAIGEFALTVIACWTATLWLLRQTFSADTSWRMTAMTPLLLLGIGIGALQVTALTPDVLAQISPHLADVLPAWSAEGTQKLVGGPWSTLSLAPYESLRSLVCVISCALLFVVAVNRLRTIDDVRRLVRSVAIAMTLMALFGSLQYLFGNGLFFGFYDHPFTNTRDYAKGAFTNPNHFADYVAMALPLLLAWYAVHSSGDGNRHRFEGPLICLCLAIVSVAILLSQSRGGLLAACIGAIVCLFFLHRVRALNSRTAGALGGIACVALLSLTLFGDRITALVEANFHELASADVSQLDRGDSRQKIWQAALEGIGDYPLLGTGLSTHREVYWTYFDYPDDGKEFSHAENGYLQLALETGLIGLGTALCCVLLWIGWCLAGLRRSRSIELGAILAAILGVIAINLAHSVTDFVWYAPSIMVVIVLLAACAATLYRQAKDAAEGSTSEVPGGSGFGFRPLGAIGLAGCLLLSGWMIPVKLPALAAEPHWFDYVRLVQGESRMTEEDDLEAHARLKYTVLLHAARADQHDARIQARAARAYQSIFEMKQRQAENPMSLLQIQDAALASEWSSPDELTEWLNRPGVLGENRKYLDTAWQRAVHALSLCPLQSDEYLVLSELAWIYGGSTDHEHALLEQALTARPYDPEVHYVAGRVESLRGNEPAALEHWKESFQRSPRFRKQITSLLAPVWPAEQFVTAFEPDTESLGTVVEAYRNSPDTEGYRRIAGRLADELSQQAQQYRYSRAIPLWRQAHDLYVELGDVEGAHQTALAAVKADPNNLQARRNLGKWLFSQEQYTDAIEHLQWCKRRSPDDAEVAGWLQAAIARQPARGAAIRPVSYQSRGGGE